MFFTLIALDNQSSAGQSMVGKTYPFSYDGRMFYFGDIHSSRVQSIVSKDGEMVITTKNSTYAFRQKL